MRLGTSYLEGELTRAGAEPVAGFRLVRRLGGGGFGEVWEAEAPGGFRVALKFVPVGRGPGNVELRSLEIIKAIRHPNLLVTFSSWLVDEFLILGMERADRTLWDRLREAQQEGRPGIPRDELIDAMDQAARGLDYLNEHRHTVHGREQVGIQHRDVKPQNLLLIGTGIKVADFGMARLLEQSITGHTGAWTFAYAAPEFFHKQTARQSDQYSLAVTYYHLRTGELPFSGSPAAVMAGHLLAEPRLEAVLPPERDVLARALAKSPKDRWPDCRAFVAALRQAAAATSGPDLLPAPLAAPEGPDDSAEDAPTAVQAAALVAEGAPLSPFDQTWVGELLAAIGAPAPDPVPTGPEDTDLRKESIRPRPSRGRRGLLAALAILAAGGAFWSAQARRRPARVEADRVGPLAMRTADFPRDPAPVEAPAPAAIDLGELPLPAPKAAEPPRDLPALLGPKAAAEPERGAAAEPVVEPAGEEIPPGHPPPAGEIAEASDEPAEAAAEPAPDPAPGPDFALLGCLHYQKGEYEPALADFDRALRADPEDAVTYNNRGLAQLALARPDRAIADFDEAIRRAPDRAVFRFNRALAHSARGAPDRAIADLDEALRLDPEYVKAYNNRGELFKRTGRLDRAVADFEQAIRRAPDDALLYNNQGLTYRRAGDLYKAIADFDQAIRLDPGQAVYHYNRGLAYAQVGDEAEAIAALTRAIALDPSFARAYRARGDAHARAGDAAQARADRDRAAALGKKG